MSQWIKQSTAVTVKLGPFTDATDGVTRETALTISQADIRLSKNGGAFAQSNNAAGATHDAAGYYGVPLDATDTNTLGLLEIDINEAGAGAVFKSLMVVPANTYDALILGTDKLQADAVELLGTAQTAGDLGALAAAIKAKTDSLTFTIAGRIDAQVKGVNASGISGSGTAADPWVPV